MSEPLNFNELAKRLSAAIPSDFLAIKGDLENNFQAILQASFSRMNLVSREEFDVQTRILEKTRTELQALEARVQILESKIDHC